MGGDYLAMQKDWMNAPPQIGRTQSLFPANRSLFLDIYYLYSSFFECFNHGAVNAG